MNQYVINVYAGETTGGRMYNNFATGELLLFDDLDEAEKFALKVENESIGNVWAEAVPYDVYKEKQPLFEYGYNNLK
ncbi:hypothetical protein [Priestia megaterium]|uniref:hypothetical protein n=1 Tax=Priestia megaterium TaxID=1404 RepID=UPI003CC5B7F0